MIPCQVATELKRRQGGETGTVAASSDEGAELQRLGAMKGIVAETGGDEADVSSYVSWSFGNSGKKAESPSSSPGFGPCYVRSPAKAQLRSGTWAGLGRAQTG